MPSDHDNPTDPTGPRPWEDILQGLAVFDADHESALETAPFYALVLDARTLVVLGANALARDNGGRALVGLPDADKGLIGRPIWTVGAESDAFWLRADLEAVGVTGKPLHAVGVEFRFQTGEARHFDWSVLPLRAPSGGIDRLLVVTTDVSERVGLWKRAARRRRIRNLEFLNEISRVLHGAREPAACLQSLVSLIQARRPCHIAAVCEYDKHTDMFRALYSNRDLPDFYPGGPVPVQGDYLTEALHDQHVMCIPDIMATESVWRERARLNGWRAAVIVPLIFEGQTHGVLLLLRAVPDSFSDEDVALFEQIGAHTAVALRNLSMYLERQKLIDRQKRLMEIGNAINACRDLDTILAMTHQAIVDTGGFERVALFLYDHASQQMQGALGTSRLGETIALSGTSWPLTLNETEGLLGETARMLRGESRYLLRPRVGDMVEDDHPLFGVGDHVEIALRARGEVLGMISVDNALTKRRIRHEDVEALLPFCDQAAMALHTMRLLDRLEGARRSAERLAQQETLVNAVSRAVGSTLDPDQVLERVLTEIRKLGDFLCISIIQPVDEAGRWRIVAAWNSAEIAERLPTEYVAYDGHQGSSPRSEHSVLNYRPDAVNDGGPYPSELTALGVRSILHVELWMDAYRLGVLNLSRAGLDAFPPDEQATLESLAPSLALALYNADVYRSLKQAQEALVRAETLRAVGELASGVAHNINNLLAAILGYSELIQLDAANPEVVRRDAKIIERAALDGAEVVKRVQRFAYPSAGEDIEPVPIGPLLEEALDLTRVLWHNEAIAKGVRIEVSSDLEPGLETMGFGVELREVFVNLIRNACDAMPWGGELTVNAIGRGQEVHVEIADTGHGMSEEVRRSIFEPFFTTKGSERGLGMGLAISWRLVERHEGHMEVETAPGQGTTMRVRLPRRYRQRGTPIDIRVDTLTARILLVEDEPPVRSALARGLSRSGAAVQTAADAGEALEWLDKTMGGFDIIVCDHGMAGVTGLELLRHVRSAYPSIRRVLLSGWGASLPGEPDLSPAELALAKPITVPSLVASLYTLMAQDEEDARPTA